MASSLSKKRQHALIACLATGTLVKSHGYWWRAQPIMALTPAEFERVAISHTINALCNMEYFVGRFGPRGRVDSHTPKYVNLTDRGQEKALHHLARKGECPECNCRALVRVDEHNALGCHGCQGMFDVPVVAASYLVRSG